MYFDQAFDVLIGHEGDYSDHPADPGGATRWGVTERVARANGYTGDMREFPRDQAKVIYRRAYWDSVRADELPEDLRYPVFDAAVNSGTTQAVKWLQRAVGTVDDGKLGPITLEAAQREPAKTAARMVGLRLDFMTSLPTWPSFGKGWSRRIASILQGV